MVEFALVSVVLFTLIFGLIEGGLLVRANNAINNSADEAARRGAIAGGDASADWLILQQIRVRGMLGAADLNHVVVFRATNSSDGPTESCRQGVPVAGECNVYERSDFERPQGDFNCSDANLDGSWCPADRSADSTSFEYVGIYIDATHSGLTGIFGDVDLTGLAALPLEGSGGE